MSIPESSDAWVKEIEADAFACMRLECPELPELCADDTEWISIGVRFGIVATVLSLQTHGLLDGHAAAQEPSGG